ncbi:MAG: DUF6597 domain-containing transcriptional factor [Pseudomonadota bacterium]
MTERLFLRLDEDPSHGPETTVPADTLRTFCVGAQLGAHVSQILLYRETFAEGAEVAERVLPDGAVRLVIHLGDGMLAGPAAERQDSVALGAAIAPVLLRWRRSSRMHSISVALRPGAASALLGVPAGELQGMAVPLDAVWGASFQALRERMSGQADDEARVALLRASLEQRLSQNVRPANPCASQAAALLAASAGRMRPGEVATAVGMGERRLQQIFRAEVGMSPKAWSRLARLRACLRALRASSPAAPVFSWAGLGWPPMAVSTTKRTWPTSSARFAGCRPPSSCSAVFRFLPRPEHRAPVPWQSMHTKGRTA